MAGRPYVYFYKSRMYNAYIEGNAPTVAHDLGEIVGVRNEDDGLPYNGAGASPFGIVYLSDLASIQQLTPYLAEWRQAIDWTVTNQTGDNFTLSVHATNPGSSGNGNLLQTQVAEVIAKWNGTIDAVNSGANNIVVNISGLGAISSEGFFGYPSVAAVTFTQTAYDSVNNVYTIQADFSKIGAAPSKVEEVLIAKGCTPLSNVNKVITFTVPRATVVAKFKAELQKCAAMVRHRRYSLNATTVTNIINAGGSAAMLFADVQAALVDAEV